MADEEANETDIGEADLQGWGEDGLECAADSPEVG